MAVDYAAHADREGGRPGRAGGRGGCRYGGGGTGEVMVAAG